MAKKIAVAPKGYRTATQVLIVSDAQAALEFYKTVFSATVSSIAYASNGATVLQADMKIGNSIIRVGDEMPEFGIVSPATLGGSPSPVHLYVEAVDDIWRKAIDANATVAVPLADAYWGERYGRFIDPFGHVWSVAQRRENLTPAELAARADAAFAPVSTDAYHQADEAAPVEGAAYLEPIGNDDTVAA